MKNLKKKDKIEDKPKDEPKEKADPLLKGTQFKELDDAKAKLQEIQKGDVVYIATNEKHALKNNGKEILKFYWIFPTNSFSEVEYFY